MAPRKAALLLFCAFLAPAVATESLHAQRQSTHNSGQGHFRNSPAHEAGPARTNEAHGAPGARLEPGAEQPSRPPAPSNGAAFAAGGTGAGGFRNTRPGSGQHLPQWLAQHQALPPSQQEDALRHEPGFSRLPEGQQQQLIDRLHRLDMEPPAQRQRLVQRNERFEAMPPERQQAIRGATQALGQMPPERREAVRQAFRDLRNLPEDERQNALNSARFQAEYSPQERTVLGNLLSIEPYQPH